MKFCLESILMFAGITTDIEAIENLREDWTSLLSRASLNNLFLTWEWIHSWLQNMMAQTETPIIIIAREGKRLVGLAPMILVRHRILGNCLQFIGQSYSYHMGFIAEKGIEDRVYNALWIHALELGARRYRTIEFLHMEEDAIFESVLKKQADMRGLILCRSIQNPCKVADLPDTFTGYLKTGIPSYHLRRNVKKDFRRLARDYNVCFHYADKTNLPKYWAEFLNLHRRQMLDKGAHSILMNPSFANHLFQVATAFLEKKALRLAVFALNDETAAIILGILYNRVFNALTIGLNPRVIRASPWLNLCVVSQIFCIRSAIESGCKQYDFLGGHHDYKYKMGGKDRAGIRIKIYRSRTDKLREQGLLGLHSIIENVRKKRTQ